MTEPPHVLHIGCYTAGSGGRGIGIQPVRADDGTLLEPMPAVDPSFLARHPRLPVLYAVSEQESTIVSAYAIAADGTLRLLNTLPTGGSAGCHLAFDPDRDLLVIANYGDGSVAICAVIEDGSLGEVVDHTRFTGHGPDTDRQQHSHAHMAIRDGGDWLIADLGADRLHRLRLEETGRITGTEGILTPAGVGPRHLVISGDLLVLACELSAELWLARRTEQDWQGVFRVPSSAAETAARVYPSGIVLAGDRVVVANRGSDTIATFALDRGANTLTLVDETSTGGSWPRELAWLRGRLWVANQYSDTLTVFEPDGAGWRLVQTVAVPSPASISG